MIPRFWTTISSTDLEYFESDKRARWEELQKKQPREGGGDAASSPPLLLLSPLSPPPAFYCNWIGCEFHRNMPEYPMMLCTHCVQSYYCSYECEAKWVCGLLVRDGF